MKYRSTVANLPIKTEAAKLAEDELEGGIARRATAQVGEVVGDGGAVAAALGVGRRFGRVAGV